MGENADNAKAKGHVEHLWNTLQGTLIEAPTCRLLVICVGVDLKKNLKFRGETHIFILDVKQDPNVVTLGESGAEVRFHGGTAVEHMPCGLVGVPEAGVADEGFGVLGCEADCECAECVWLDGDVDLVAVLGEGLEGGDGAPACAGAHRDGAHVVAHTPVRVRSGLRHPQRIRLSIVPLNLHPEELRELLQQQVLVLLTLRLRLRRILHKRVNLFEQLP